MAIKLNTISENIFSKIGFGFIACNICGRFSKIRIKTTNFREDCLCKNCNSNSRKRHIARVILKSLFNNKYASLKRIPESNGFAIYNTESNGALHEYLKHADKYVSSEYFGPYETFGKEKNGVLNIDLMNIPFSENSFDLVISTEVFEHIPDPYMAFKEVYRILKIGGSHIFTVPYYEKEEKDEKRSEINERNEIVYLMEPQYHGDPVRSDQGVLVYTIFSKEMVTKLEKIRIFSSNRSLHRP